MNIEKYMKLVLDGTYTYINNDGKVVTDAVDDGAELYKPNKKSPNKVWWSTLEDSTLLAMRTKKHTFSEIAWILNRSEDAVKKRFSVLRCKHTVVE